MESKLFKSFIKSKRKREGRVTPVREFNEEVKSLLETIYEDGENPKERINIVMKKVESFFKYISRDIFPEEKMEEIRSKLSSCVVIQGKEDFIKEIIDILKPIFDIRKSFPVEFEETESRMSNAELGYIELNRLVSYEKVGDTIKLHHSKARTIGPKLELYNNAMKRLASIIKGDPEIQKIVAVSWIVHRVPGLFTKNGFSVEKLPAYSISSLHVSSGNEKDPEGRPIALASISREKFLEVFGGDLHNK